MNKAKVILLFLLSSFFFNISAQNLHKTDSLENIFEQATNDSTRNTALKQLFNEYLKDNWGMAINTAKNGISLFKETNPKNTIFWYNKLGDIYSEQGFYALSLNAFSDALKVSNNNNLNSARILLKIAKIYYRREEFDKSIEIYQNAIQEFNNLKQSDPESAELGIAKTYNKLGIVYELKNELDTSKIFFKKALKLRLKINNPKDIADSYTSLGFFSNVVQEYDSAVYYFTKGLEVCSTYNNFHYFNDLHLFRSTTYSKLKQFDKAFCDIDTAKQYALTFNKFDMARVYYFNAQTDFENNNYEKLKSNAEIALQYADSFNNISIKTKTLKLLVKAAEKFSDFEDAFKYQKQLTEYIKLNETEKLIQLEKNIELETKEKQNIELSEKNKGLKKSISLFQILLIVGILIFLFLLILIIANRKKNKKIKKALQLAENEKKKAEKAQKELLDSTEIIRSQAALAEILRNVTGKERSIEEFLQDALNKMLALPWLNLVSKGSVFLTNEDGNLEMVAEKDLGEVAVRCALIKPGECLCGKALSEKKMQFCNHIDHKHEIRFKNMAEHGHYNLPIMMNDEVLGVLNLYTEHQHQKTDSEIRFLGTVADTLASVINRKKSQDDILKTKNELELQKTKLEERNKSIRLYSTQIEQRNREQEILNQTIRSQKKVLEQKQKETEEYAKQLEEQAKKQEILNQELFTQKLELEQQKTELEEYAKQLENQSKEQEALNQKLFAQKLEVEQRNSEVELYSKQLEEQSKEQEALNQKLFAQKLEVEQRNSEVELYSKQLEEKAKEQEALNQQLFAQKLEVEQRNSEIEQYVKQIEEQKKEQEALNQKLFAQSLEVDQRRLEIEIYSKQIEELKEKAESALKHLNDSINYSKYIQTSLLPDFNYIKNILPGDFFVYFNPKEIIGGDFYYFKKSGDYLIFAVADCTGHGVPGALITMLGISFLDDIVSLNLVDQTGEALNQLRRRVKETFHSYGNSLENKNGLDIALCAVNLKTNIMQYSGAFNSLIIARNDELNEYKATRNPIGYYPIEKDFETTKIKLQKDDVIYLFSDGYADQIGGERNRKFSKRQFKSLLEEIHQYPMSKQSVFMEKIMQKWMGNNQQVDDITVMGIKWENEV